LDGRDEKYSRAKWTVSAVLLPLMKDDAGPSALTSFGELIDTVDMIPGKSPVLEGTSRPGCSKMKLRSGESQSHQGIASLTANQVPDWSPIKEANPVKPECHYPST